MTLCPTTSALRREWTQQQHSRWDELVVEGYARLDERIVKHKIELPNWHPRGDVAVVCRLPPPLPKQRTSGGLYIPEVAQETPEPYSIGVLLMAGAEALDILQGDGILIGDYVKIAWLAGREEDVQRENTAIREAMSEVRDQVSRALGEGAKDLDQVEAEARAEAEKKLPKQSLQLNAADIKGSVDLMDRLHGASRSMELVRTYGPQGVLTIVRPIVE